ncbi:DUF1844 domain-containing protein [bacterium]|nr:DUF1844 domain-containing protein [bacterium]
MTDERNHEREPEEGILISDKRHARDLESEAEAANPEPAPPPEKPAATSPPQPPVEPAGQPEPPAEPVGEVVDFQPPQRPAEPEEPGESELPPLDTESPEMLQLKMLFEMGLPGYLHGQLQLVLNFAVIYLGRQPNPATGLVSVDLDKARLAIDLFDFIIKNTRADLPESDYAGLLNVAKNLKMEYADVAGQGPAPSGGTPPNPGN